MPEAFGCVKNTIKLLSGKYLDLRDPQPDQFDLRDIAGALSKICRFGGHCRNFYSVAEHSIHCSRVAYGDRRTMSARRAVLMHDAAEAFIGDMVKPLKIMMGEFQAVEARIEAAVAAKFDIDFQRHKDIVSEIDHAMLIAERRAMFDADNVTWHGEDQVRRLDVSFWCATPHGAENAFMAEAKLVGLN